MSGIGGYVRRSERRYVPLVPDDGTRCTWCRARLTAGGAHFCQEITPGTPSPQLHFEPFGDDAGVLLHRLLNPELPPGPPYTHTLVPPETVYWDEDGGGVRPEPGPTITEGPG